MRQASNPLVALLMLPGILVFEFAWQAGYLRERVRAGSPFRFRGGGARP